MAYKMLVKDMDTGQCAVADVPCPPAALTAMAPIHINGQVIMLDIVELATALGHKDCNGNPIITGADLVTCQNLLDALAALNFGDVKLVAAQGYNATTNVLTLLMSDGTTVPVDLTAHLNDAVATALAQVTHPNINFTSPDGTVTTTAAGHTITAAVNFAALISSQAGNVLALGSDGKLYVPAAAASSDKFLQSMFSYDPVTNILQLSMNDGSLVPVDMTALINDALNFANVTATTASVAPIPIAYYGTGPAYVRPDGFININGKKVPYVN